MIDLLRIVFLFEKKIYIKNEISIKTIIDKEKLGQLKMQGIIENKKENSCLLFYFPLPIFLKTSYLKISLENLTF